MLLPARVPCAAWTLCAREVGILPGVLALLGSCLAAVRSTDAAVEIFALQAKILVDPNGIEPMTSTMPW